MRMPGPPHQNLIKIIWMPLMQKLIPLQLSASVRIRWKIMSLLHTHSTPRVYRSNAKNNQKRVVRNRSEGMLRHKIAPRHRWVRHFQTIYGHAGEGQGRSACYLIQNFENKLKGKGQSGSKNHKDFLPFAAQLAQEDWKQTLDLAEIEANHRAFPHILPYDNDQDQRSQQNSARLQDPRTDKGPFGRAVGTAGTNFREKAGIEHGAPNKQEDNRAASERRTLRTSIVREPSLALWTVPALSSIRQQPIVLFLLQEKLHSTFQVHSRWRPPCSPPEPSRKGQEVEIVKRQGIMVHFRKCQRGITIGRERERHVELILNKVIVIGYEYTWQIV